MKPNHRKQNKYNTANGSDKRQVDAIDGLAEYEDFVNNILPKLRKMVAQGKGATDIYKVAEAEMAARMVTIALTEKDPKSAMQAVKECLDRSLGKAKETMEVTAKYESLNDEDLDKRLAQQEAALEQLAQEKLEASQKRKH